MFVLIGEPDPNDPPGWCFRTNDQGELPTCTFSNGQWHRTYEGSIDTGPDMGGFAVLFVLALFGGLAVLVWKVSTARRMARESGMSEGDATAMTLLSDDGFEATYLASNLRPQPSPAAPAPAPDPAAPSAVRLRDLKELLDQELISQAEYDARRQAIIDAL